MSTLIKLSMRIMSYAIRSFILVLGLGRVSIFLEIFIEKYLLDVFPKFFANYLGIFNPIKVRAN